MEIESWGTMETSPEEMEKMRIHREKLIEELYGHLPVRIPPKQKSEFRAACNGIFLPALVVTALGGPFAGIAVAGILFAWHLLRNSLR
jgi:hypothetical protein